MNSKFTEIPAREFPVPYVEGEERIVETNSAWLLRFNVMFIKPGPAISTAVTSGKASKEDCKSSPTALGDMPAGLASWRATDVA